MQALYKYFYFLSTVLLVDIVIEATWSENMDRKTPISFNL